MNKSIAVKLKKVLPSVILLAIVVLLAGLSFLPSVRGTAAVASARSSALDPEAIRVLNCCRAYAAVNDFSTKLNGSIKAKVYGIPYTQGVSGARTVEGEDFCMVTESASAFVKAGMKKQCENGEYSVTDADYKKKAFVYGSPKKLERDRYIATYGKPSTGLVKYELDGSIISAERVDDDTFRFVLDARRATRYSRNEVRAILGGKSYPEYEAVEFTLTTDGERAVKITYREQFTVDRMGGTRCTAQFTEVFEY